MVRVGISPPSNSLSYLRCQWRLAFGTVHSEADYDEEAAFDGYFNPEAGHRAGPEG